MIKKSFLVSTIIDISTGCESGWSDFQNACYKTSSQEVSWESARANCLINDSHLASILSVDEQKFIWNLVAGSSYWIGGQLHGNWKWEDGNEFSYTNWYSGQPNQDGDCLYILNGWTGQWGDGDCSSSNYYICKKLL